MQHFDYIIVGGGLVGAATFYKLQKAQPQAKIAILEKESSLSRHQSGRNSGVIHSGLYYKPGTYKAKNCVDGRQQLVAFAMEHGIDHDVCGKIVVARSEAEHEQLLKLKERGAENGLTGLELLDEAGAKKIEPNVRAISALFVPQSGIIDYPAVCNKLVEEALKINSSSKLICNFKVEAINELKGKKIVSSAQEDLSCNFLIACAGLFSDRLAKLDGIQSELKIVGFRGDYYELEPHALGLVNNLIYPVPNPEFPFLGVHFTRMTNGAVECGPNAVFTFKREGYNKRDFSLRDSWQALSFSGTQALFKKHWKHGLQEYRRAFSKKRFLAELRLMIPKLQMSDIKPARAGVRAMALLPDGSMYDDFAFERGDKSLHVLNAPSPAATACLSIADEVVKKALEQQS